MDHALRLLKPTSAVAKRGRDARIGIARLAPEAPLLRILAGAGSTLLPAED